MRKIVLIAFGLLFLIMTYTAGLQAQNVKSKKVVFKDAATFSLDSVESNLPKGPWDFCVTDDELVLLPNYLDGNIGIYENNAGKLTLVDVIGKKGTGPNGLLNPTFIEYNKEENRLAVMDHGLKKLFTYRRSVSGVQFQREYEIPCWFGAHDFKLSRDKLFVSGALLHPQTKQRYELYSIDLSSGDRKNPFPKEYLLTASQKYFDPATPLSREKFEEKYKASGIREIGRIGYFDIRENSDDLFMVWEGDFTRILKINSENEKVDLIGDQDKARTKNNSKPVATSELKAAYKKGDAKAHHKEKSKLAIASNLFVGSDYIVLVYEKKKQQDSRQNRSRYWIQFLDLNGNFINETSIDGNPGQKFDFDPQRAILYTLSGKEDEKGFTIFNEMRRYQIQ